MNDIVPDSEAAQDFLQHFSTEGPWQLQAIDPERKKKLIAQMFEASQTAQKLAFLKHWNGKRNLYFSPNVPRELMDTKAEKKDIGWITTFHVDIDPPAPPPDCSDEWLKEQQDAILARLRAYTPKPSLIVFSGGGYQAYWLLKDPIEIESPEQIEYLEAINRRFEKDLGGDHCFNIDRIMRVPGTVNLPDAKKLAKGRKPALAYLVEADWQLLYDDKLVEPWFEEKKPRKAAKTKVVDGNRPLPEWALRVLANGPDHEGDRSYGGDRSKALWAVICTMIRKQWDLDDIVEAILNKENKLSEHVYAQSNPQKYARRQAERAYDFAGGDFVRHPKTDAILPNPYNVRLAIDKLDCRLSYNAFSRKMMIEGPDSKPSRVLVDEELTDLYILVEEEFHFRPSKEHFADIIDNYARKKSYHPVQQYLSGLKWDGVKRIDRWLTIYGGAEDTPYTRAVGRLMLIAACRRVRQPGCKFDEIMIFESDQGLNKSTALAVLAVDEDWFTDSLPINATEKEIIELLSGKWIVEIAELRGLRGNKNIEHLKAFASRRIDRARLAWGRIMTEARRQCVLFASTNTLAYFRDTTGNRRFWPVRVVAFDVAALRADVNQLWAEAAYEEAQGASIRLDPSLYEAAAVEQDKRTVHEPWVAQIETSLGSYQTGRILMSDLWMMLDIKPGFQTQEHNARLGESMQALGWERKRYRVNGKPQWHYSKGTDEEREARIYVTRDEYGAISVGSEAPPSYMDAPPPGMDDIPFN